MASCIVIIVVFVQGTARLGAQGTTTLHIKTNVTSMVGVEREPFPANIIVKASAPVCEPAATPAVALGFLALDDNLATTPPDTMGAVGPSHVMTMLNTEVRFHSRDGAILKTVPLRDFWANLETPNPFDPRVAYDPYGQRWILAAASNQRSGLSSLLVGASETSDPMGNWNLYRIKGIGQNVRWADFPNLGFNKNWIVVQISMNDFNDDAFVESQIFVFSKAELYAGGAGDYRLFHTTTLDLVQAPAVTYDNDLGSLYLVSTTTSADGSNHTFTISAIEGAVGAEQFRVVKTFDQFAPWSAFPPGSFNFGPQLGSPQKIDVQDSGRLHVVYRNGSLWFGHAIYLPANNPNRSAIQWVQATTTAVQQRGLIDDPSGQTDYAHPSLSVNKRNDVLIGFSQFSASQYPAGAYAARAGFDPPNTTRPPRILKAGEGPYFKTRGTGSNRWGDFSNTVVDPADDLTFWTIQEYARLPEGDPSLDNSGRWGTWWGQIPAPGRPVNLGFSLVTGLPEAVVNSPFGMLIRVTNAGPCVATGVRLVLSNSAAATIVSSQLAGGSCQANGPVLTCSLPSLAGWASAEATIWLRNSSAGILTSQIALSSDQTDDDIADNLGIRTFRVKADSDADKMADDWEQANGLNPSSAGDAQLDGDLDGGSNLQEYWAGTDPKSGGSVLRLMATRARDGVVLQVPTVAGRLYRLESAASVSSSSWQAVQDFAGTGTGFETSAAVAGQQRYYRVRLLLVAP